MFRRVTLANGLVDQKTDLLCGGKLKAAYYDLFSFAATVTYVFPRVFESGVKIMGGIKLRTELPAERE